MALCFEKYSSDKKNSCKFESEGQEFDNILRSLEQFIQTLKQNAFLTCFWRFLRSNSLEQFKLEKIIEI